MGLSSLTVSLVFTLIFIVTLPASERAAIQAERIRCRAQRLCVTHDLNDVDLQTLRLVFTITFVTFERFVRDFDGGCDANQR